MPIGKRKGKVVKGAGNPGSTGSDAIGGSLSKNDHWYLQQGFGFGGEPGAAPIPSSGHSATGGIISDFTDPTGQLYRAHIFLQSGTFTVTSVGSLPMSPTKPAASVEVLAVGGGGAGGLTAPSGYGAGGGGAGGVVTNMTGHPRANATNATVAEGGSYPVTVGAGGGPPSGTDKDAQTWNDGNQSQSPVWSVSATGGGAGGNGSPTASSPNNQGRPGGSGGGSAGSPLSGGAGNTPNPVSPVQGYAGGTEGGAVYGGGGGGGAGEVGRDGPSPTRPMYGGNGIQVAFAGPPTNSPIGTPGNTSNGTSPTDTGYFGGGGGGGNEYGTVPGLGGSGGGANGDIDSDNPEWLSGAPGPREGQANTGGGGGGKSQHSPYPYGELGKSSGGSGIYAIRYKIGSGQTKTAVCSGGDICFSPTKTIHAFTTSGTFTAPGSFSETCEYVVIGGGGGGGDTRSWSSHGGAGGGAGAVIASTAPFTGPFTKTITVGQGGTRGTQDNWGAPGGNSSILPGVVTAKGGGGGGGSGNATSDAPHMDGRPSSDPGGGSGGGSAYVGNNGTGGTYGNNGGDQSPPGGGAGGGGAGGAGGVNVNGPGAPNPTSSDKRQGGAGGLGVQLPATFRTNVPSVFGVPGPSGTGWVGGGGGGGNAGPDSPADRNGGTGGGGPNLTPWAGGGNGDTTNPTGAPTRSLLVNGITNTGGGGGGGNGSQDPSFPWGESWNGHGGSGLVLIAYPT